MRGRVDLWTSLVGALAVERYVHADTRGEAQAQADDLAWAYGPSAGRGVRGYAGDVEPDEVIER